MKLEISITNRQVSVLIIFFTLLAIFGAAGAFNTPPASYVGHTINEIDWSQTIPSINATALTASTFTAATATPASLCLGGTCKADWPDFGSWETRQEGVSYHAGTDGFVLAWANAGSGHDYYVRVLTDSSNPPIMVRIQGNLDNDHDQTVTLFCPVKKGDYYMVEKQHSSVIVNGVFWLPIGS